MSTMKLGTKLLAGGLLGLSLMGCRSRPNDFHVQVRNNTGGVIITRVMRDDEPSITVIHQAQVYPRDRGEISLPRRRPGERLELQVDAPNNPSKPPRMPLNPGMTYVNVTREGDEGPIKLELVR